MTRTVEFSIFDLLFPVFLMLILALLMWAIPLAIRDWNRRTPKKA